MSQKKSKAKLPFFREAQFRVAELLFNKPTQRFHLRKLAKATGFSTTAVAQAIEKLAAAKIIAVQRTELALEVRADLKSAACLSHKRMLNLYRLERCGSIRTLEEMFRPEAIVLFGSYAKGEDIEGSDIDLLVLTDRKEPEDFRNFLGKAEKELNRPISMHLLPSLDESAPEFRNAVANGIVLQGYVKVC